MIENNKVVAIDYSVTDEANQLIDTSEGREPLKYLHGTGNITVSYTHLTLPTNREV